MLEIRVTVEAKDLAQAINNLASAMGGGMTAKAAQPTAPQQPMQVQPQQPQQQMAAPLQQPLPTAPQAAPVTQPAAAPVPIAQPPKYTVDQIMAAGATLMDAGKTNELLGLLQRFGVQAVMDLKEEQLGQFATALRELGAKI